MESRQFNSYAVVCQIFSSTQNFNNASLNRILVHVLIQCTVYTVNTFCRHEFVQMSRNNFKFKHAYTIYG